MKKNTLNTYSSWKEAWSDKIFRKSFLICLFLLLIILIQYPFFFLHIEKRQGFELNDFMLNYLPMQNLSLVIFICIWLNILLLLLTAYRHPKMALLFLWSYLIMNVFRIGTMLMVPLEPPKGLIVLMDPISNQFYGKNYITKDLFFSGHTSTMFLVFLCFRNYTLKTIALAITFSVGIMVLIQRVHYSLDVLAALPFSYLAYKAAKRIIVILTPGIDLRY